MTQTNTNTQKQKQKKYKKHLTNYKKCVYYLIRKKLF
jgi:hypothetical protein